MSTEPPPIPTDFPLEVPDAVLEDLARRIDATRWPARLTPDWQTGTDLEWLREVVAYWRDGFDWRAQEQRLNTLMPSSRVRLRGIDLHYARVPGRGPRPFPLMLLHGWPSSFAEMHRIVGPLSDPVAHGGSELDAFELIVPSLPGHGLSGPAEDPRFGADDAADVMRDLMVDVLGFGRFGAHGGDRGAFVAMGLGHRHPESVAGIHLSLAMGIAGDGDDRTPEEDRWLEAVAAWQAEEAGYSAIQSTRPMTLSYAMMDSPIGLAAWILEKFRAWSDCNGNPDSRFSRDELLTNVMIYWWAGSIGTSMLGYWAHRQVPPVAVRPERIDVPTGIAQFPKEVMRPPRSAIERKYQLERFTEMPSGGHFAALEEPEALVEEIRAFYRQLRPA